MDGHQLHMLLEEENPYLGADGEYNGDDMIDGVYFLLMVSLVTYWSLLGESLCSHLLTDHWCLLSQILICSRILFHLIRFILIQVT